MLNKNRVEKLEKKMMPCDEIEVVFENATLRKIAEKLKAKGIKNPYKPMTMQRLSAIWKAIREGK